MTSGAQVIALSEHPYRSRTGFLPCQPRNDAYQQCADPHGHLGRTDVGARPRLALNAARENMVRRGSPRYPAKDAASANMSPWTMALRTMPLRSIASQYTFRFNAGWRNGAREVAKSFKAQALTDAKKLSQTGRYPCLSTSTPIPAPGRRLPER